MEFVDELNDCSDFAEIFYLVKRAVEITLNKRRVGLILGLTDLPSQIGAFHTVGSNFIVMNRSLLKQITNACKNRKLINAYIFHILLHEYIHSLGYLDERLTQDLTYAISEKVLGEEHPAAQIAKYGIISMFPSIRMEYQDPRIETSTKIEIVDDFERDNLSYFG
jgi:hypothetical protein